MNNFNLSNVLNLQVIEPINKLLDTIEFDAVFYSLDWHPSDHVSFIDNIKQRPIHPTSPVSVYFSFYSLHFIFGYFNEFPEII